MIEGTPGIDRRRKVSHGEIRADAPAPTPEPVRSADVRGPSREQLVAAARERAAPPTSAQSIPLKKIAVGAGVTGGGLFAGTILANLAAMWGIHKVMDKVGDFLAGPIVKGILKLGKLNPFSWVWNKIVGEKGGSHGHDDHGHGGGHAPAAHH